MPNREKDLKKALLGEALINQQPPLIRQRLQADRKLGQVLGFEPVQGWQVSPGVSVCDKDLYSATRSLLSGEGDVTFNSLEGDPIILSKRGGHICLNFESAQRQHKSNFDELRLLSPKREERTMALERIRREFRAPDPDMRALCSIAEERELSDDEVRLIHKAWTAGVARNQRLLGRKLEEGTATFEDIVPASWHYYQRFCGPEPNDSPPRLYFSSSLPEYRKELLEKDLSSGLELCLLGCLHDDLLPGPWLASVSNDDLWIAVERSRPDLDPFSCLGALDLAIYRIQDERFRDFAERIVDRLTANEFSRPDSNDVYILLPLLARSTLNQMNLLESGCLRSPLWRRLCAWMQANLVLRQLHHVELDMRSLSEYAESHLSEAGEFASLLDFRILPMTTAQDSLLSPSALRYEILSRLAGMKQRHLAAGREVPKPEEIEAAVNRIAEEGTLVSLFLPGPLEGHVRPADLGREISDELKSNILNKFSLERHLDHLAFLSQVFHLDQELLSAVSEALSNTSLDIEGFNVLDKSSILLNSAIIAAAERDRELASIIAISIKNTAPQIDSLDYEEQVRMVRVALYILLIAGSAIEEEVEWAQWLGQEIAEFAKGLPGGKVSAALWSSLQELRRVTKLQLHITNRAEAIASAAAWN